MHLTTIDTVNCITLQPIAHECLLFALLFHIIFSWKLAATLVALATSQQPFLVPGCLQDMELYPQSHVDALLVDQSLTHVHHCTHSLGSLITEGGLLAVKVGGTTENGSSHWWWHDGHYLGV